MSIAAVAQPLDARENLSRALTLGAVLLCAVYIVVRPLANQFEPYSGESAFAGLVLCLLGAVCGAIFLLARESILPSPLALATVLWTGLLLWGAARSPHQGKGIPYAADFAGYILLMLCGFVLAQRDRRIFPLACRLLIAMAVVEAFSGIWQQCVDFPRMLQTLANNKELIPEALQGTAGRARLSGGNVFGSFVYPNSLGAYLLLGMLLLCGGVLAAPPERRLKVAFLAAIGSVLMLLASYFTGSKGALMALVGGAWTWFVVRQAETHPARARWLYGITFIGIAALITVFTLATFGVISTRPFGLSLQVRFDYWRSAFGMIAMEPLQGIGLGGFAEHYSYFKTPLGTEAKETHNDYLQLWVELGVAGLVAYLGLWTMLLRQRFAENTQPAFSPEHEPQGRRFETMSIAGVLVAFLFMYVSFEPLTSIDLWNLVRGNMGEGVLIGALFALAIPAIFVCVLIITRGMNDFRTMSWAAKAAIAAVLLHQLIDFDLRAQAVLGAIFLLGGMLVAGAPNGPVDATRFERIGRSFPLALSIALLPFSFWIPAQSGLARASADALEEDAKDLAAKRSPKPDEQAHLAELRREVVRLRREALDQTPYDSEAWVDLALAMEASPWEKDSERRKAVETALKEARQRRPYSPIPLALLANFYARDGEWAESAGWYSRAQARYPLHPGPRLWLGDALLMSGNVNDAADEYLSAFAIDQKINDTNVRLSAIFTDPRAGVFARHTREAEVFQRIERVSSVSNEQVASAGLELRRLTALCAMYRDVERSKAFPENARRQMAAEIRATAEDFFNMQRGEGQRAHAALFVALSYEIGADLNLAAEKKAAWERAKKLHAEAKNVASTEESLFERVRLLYDK